MKLREDCRFVLTEERATVADVGRTRRSGNAWGCDARWLIALLSAAMIALVSPSASAQQIQDPWRSDTRPAPPGGPPGAGLTLPPNVTVVPRSAPAGGAQEVQFTAFLTDDGPPIDQGLVWNIFQDSDKESTPPRHHRMVRDANPVIKLVPGRYLVNVSFGRANLTRTIAVEAGVPLNERFVLNAGGLRVSAQLGDGTPAPEAAVSYDIYSGETDQLGNRQRILSGARPGLIMRLNAGIFHIVSRYGDANAVVNADVTVEAGKLTEATIAHPGASVTFKLVTRPGGEAQSGAQWAILDPDGEVIKESAGALPTHVLAAGSYVVTARHSGRVFRHGFTVQAGETTQIEVVMK
ncbi:MAG TPA: hypothetical protein VNZ50_13580 [Hyphomicrobiaceae bacterium]|nr:hypothetical protein [Hyphomicrobiaceae bacterium]